jgi:hypothetical protein
MKVIASHTPPGGRCQGKPHGARGDHRDCEKTQSTLGALCLRVINENFGS